MNDGTARETWDHYWIHQERSTYINHTPELLATLRQHVEIRGRKVLEIGVGTGGDSSVLASAGARVTVLDFSAPALARTQVTAERGGVDLLGVRADAFSLPFGQGTFDLIFHQGFLEHFRDPRSLVNEQRRVLRDGGHLLVDVPQRYNLYTLYKRRLIKQGCWPYGGWEREFSYGELRALLEAAGFRVVAAYGRGYYPRPWEMLRNLPKAETKLLGRRVLPAVWWRPYRQIWAAFERSALGIYTLQSVGTLSIAV